MRVWFAGRRSFRRFVYGWVAVVMLAGMPTTARADCLSEAVGSCNADFSGGGWIMAGIRGWCYVIRAGICAAET